MSLPAEFAPYLVLATILVVLIAFVTERARIEFIALGAAAFLVLVRVLDIEDVLASLSNPAPFTVACMFVLSAALERTGWIEDLGSEVARMARPSPALALAMMMASVAGLSAFVNNTPVVVALTPLVMALARNIGEPASRFLIPLSYAAIMGGTATLIGTSTNLVVDGVAQASGLRPFGLFEISAVGIPLTVIGILYMVLFGRRLLPSRDTLSELLPDPSKREFLAEVLVPLGSPLIGKTLRELGVAKKLKVRVIDLIRDDRSLGEIAEFTPLAAGDRILLRTRAQDLVELRSAGDLVFGSEDAHALEPITARQTILMEGIVGPNSRWVGRKVASLNLQRRFGVSIVAIHRQNENLRGNFDETRLRFGDTLLLEGPPEAFRQLFDDQFLIGLTAPTVRPFRRDRRWVAMAAVLGVVAGASFNLMPIPALALLAASLVVLAGCLEPDDVFQSVRWSILILIYAMLAVGFAMQKTGAAGLIVEGVLETAGQLGPHGVLALLYLITLLLTETISHNATGILMTPIAVGVAHELGVDPRPFVVMVMVAASNGYATPIGYQTNTFVYAAGNYSFRDFIRVGVPLDLLFWIAASLLIPMIWPFHPEG